MPEPMDFPHILAAGGIVVRHDPEPRIGVVQLRRNKAWVLPKGKLSGKETALDAARREVLEETGHDVSVHEFVGTITYNSRGKPKVVQFWRMQAVGDPARKLMRDVRAVEWLPLAEAIDRLSRPRERVFLENVGPVVLDAAEDKTEQAKTERPRAVKARRKTRRPRPAALEEPAAPMPTAESVQAMPAPIEAPREIVAVPAARDAIDETPMPAAEASPAPSTAPARRSWLRLRVFARLFGRGPR